MREDKQEWQIKQAHNKTAGLSSSILINNLK